jgi:hypothetical protein
MKTEEAMEQLVNKTKWVVSKSPTFSILYM